MNNALIGLILLTYPFVIYFGLSYFAPTVLALFLALLFTVRHFSQAKISSKKQSKIPHINILLINVLCLLLYTSISNSPLALKFYPVVVNLSFFFIFSYSLFKPPSVVEIIARMKDDLDDEGITYTRKVTIIWCVFFCINGLISTWTIFHPDPQYWIIYNGLISYILMGSLMASEYAYRRLVIKRTNNSQSIK